ncbi:MAG: hypothetical protein OEM27_00180 [Nitrospinota bacterium]|nr:hypothetical protein [Nitrospinota bacterium]
MRHQTNHKNLYQRVLLTVFSSFLFIGLAGVTSAQAEVLSGVAKGKVFCDKGSATIAKGKFKENILIDATFTQGSPDFFGEISSFTIGTISGNGIGLGKNTRKGSFSFMGTDGFTSVSMTGNYVLDKTGTILLKASGKIIVHDFSAPGVGLGSACYATGSFNAKFDPNLNP